MRVFLHGRKKKAITCTGGKDTQRDWIFGLKKLNFFKKVFVLKYIEKHLLNNSFLSVVFNYCIFSCFFFPTRSEQTGFSLILKFACSLLIDNISCWWDAFRDHIGKEMLKTIKRKNVWLLANYLSENTVCIFSINLCWSSLLERKF